MAPLRKIDWDAQPLGTVTDGDLARRLGVDKWAVANERRKRKIAPLVDHPAAVSARCRGQHTKLRVLAALRYGARESPALAEATGRSRRMVLMHLRRLIDEGLVDRELIEADDREYEFRHRVYGSDRYHTSTAVPIVARFRLTAAGRKKLRTL